MQQTYERFRDIPQFPHAGYRVNIGWNYIDGFLENAATKYNLDPDYQRGYVWSEYQKERFIEYCLRGGISGKDIYWNSPNWNLMLSQEDEWENTLELVDGKQRISAVKGFLNGEVRAFGKLITEYKDTISYFKQDLIFHVNNLKSKREVVEWYLGLNAGGSIHTEEDLKTAYAVLEKLKAEK